MDDRLRQGTKQVRRERRRDTLLAHCIARGIIAEYGGYEQAVEALGPNAERLGKWAGVRATVKVTPKASRVAAFVVMWAIAMVDTESDSFSITEYQRYWHEGERQAYRAQKEFRELWPDFETPHELAVQLLKQLDAKKASKRELATLPSVVVVTA